LYGFQHLNSKFSDLSMLILKTNPNFYILNQLKNWTSWYNCNIVESDIKHHSLNLTSYRQMNRIGGEMVSVLASSAVDCGLEPRSGQTKDYKIGIWCFSTKHAALRRKSKHWLAQNQNNVSEWSAYPRTVVSVS
jgi:hypothetical protein